MVPETRVDASARHLERERAEILRRLAGCKGYLDSRLASQFCKGETREELSRVRGVIDRAFCEVRLKA